MSGKKAMPARSVLIRVTAAQIRSIRRVLKAEKTGTGFDETDGEVVTDTLVKVVLSYRMASPSRIGRKQ